MDDIDTLEMRLCRHPAPSLCLVDFEQYFVSHMEHNDIREPESILEGKEIYVALIEELDVCTD